jgi:HPt (histidine-containing phosphotransfer) domain-containing protein
MYYIINQDNKVVAVDPQLVSKLNIDNADEFYKKVSVGEITFDLKEDAVSISVDGNIQSFSVLVSPLEGMLGDIRLVDVGAPVTITSDETASEKEEMINFDDIDLFEEKERIEETEPVVEEQAAEEEKEEELFELILPTDADNAIEEIEGTETVKETVKEEEIALQEPKEEETPVPEDENGPIYIDVERISETIGITPDDYNVFLNEYIDTALTFEQALQSNEEEKKKEALDTLTHLSNVLHLPFVGDMLAQIKSASLSERDSAIESFFATLGRLTTAHFENEKQPSTEGKTAQETAVPVETVVSKGARGPIDLSDIKPVHFDFQLEEAAQDLNLPVELIEEFVNDFIQQAHEETKKMLAAYEKGDLETVQKIGHLLKGTSSNLRINPLAETLYEIQFNDDIDRVPELVKNYWAHFLSLENQIKLISKK